MGLKSKIDFGKVKDKITKNNLPLIANEIIVDIIKRTQSGKDVNNKNFKTYTKEYKQTKKQEFGSSTVNLTQKQQMLNDISWSPIPNGIKLFFKTSQQNKKAHGNQIKNKRKFFGLDPRQEQKIKEKLINLSKK